MIAELGHFSMVLALVLTAVLGLIPMIGTFLKPASGRALMDVAGPASIAFFGLSLLSFLCLGLLFVGNDFTVKLVATHSNLSLPIAYRIAATWGSHEGSMLLWVLMLAGWTAAVAIWSGSLPQVLRVRILSTLGLISIGFLLFLIYTSNPFERLIPGPADGRDLNPLLQDPGMVFHPPLLYMGYVGLSVAFAFAVAGLIGGRFDAAWARWARPWTTVAWAFLTLGIALGSFWAYYELGWGGWWFWDPVENASFMPWLVATALIHSLAVTEKRGTFRSWTVLLANNVVLVVAMAAVLLGTLYPLILDTLELGKISVGPPYFEAVFFPLMAPAMFLMVVAPLARWKATEVPDLAKRLRWAFGVAVAAALLQPLTGVGFRPIAAIGLAFGLWITAGVIIAILEMLRGPDGRLAPRRGRMHPASVWGMQVVTIIVARKRRDPRDRTP